MNGKQSWKMFGRKSCLEVADDDAPRPLAALMITWGSGMGSSSFPLLTREASDFPSNLKIHQLSLHF